MAARRGAWGNFACRVVRNIKSYASLLFLLPRFIFLISDSEFEFFLFSVDFPSGAFSDSSTAFWHFGYLIMFIEF